MPIPEQSPPATKIEADSIENSNPRTDRIPRSVKVCFGDQPWKTQQMKSILTSNDHHRRAAFTLMEVLLVLAIMGVIMTMVVPRLMGRQTHANVDATKISIAGVRQALKLYSLDHLGSLPAASEGLSVLTTRPAGDDRSWRGPYLDSPPKDAWGTELRYQFPGRNNPDFPDIISAGPDRTFDTTDDILGE